MFNTTDEITNDFLFISNILKKLPSKTILYELYDTKKVLDYINNFILNEVHTKEIISDFDEEGNKITSTNERKLLKIGSNIYINFIIIGKQNNIESYIKDITLFYDNDYTTFELGKECVKKKVSELIDDLKLCIKEDDKEEENKEEGGNIFGVSIVQGNLSLHTVENLPSLEGSIKQYFNTTTYKETKNIFKEIKKTNKGLSVFFGERGTGKTTLVSNFLRKSDKSIIWVPISLIEQIIFSDFNNFLISNKNSIIILDDSENFFSISNHKCGIYTNCLMQLIDGYFSDTLNLHIILILNTDKDSLDQSLFECNNIIGHVEFTELDEEKIEELKKDLGITKNTGKKLVNIIKNNINQENISEIGFI